MAEHVMLPLLAIKDSRLKPNHLRVLAVVFSNLKNDFFTGDLRSIFLATNISKNRISESLRDLQSFGWIEKTGLGRGLKIRFIDQNTNIVPDGVERSIVPDGVERSVQNTSIVPDGVDRSRRGGTMLGIYSIIDKNSINVPDGVDRSEQEMSRHSSCNLITNNNTDTESDLIRRKVQIISLLGGMGIPAKFLSNSQDQSIIDSWVSDGVCNDLLKQAVDRARKFKKGDAVIGASYLSRVIATIKSEKKSSSQSQAMGGYLADAQNI